MYILPVAQSLPPIQIALALRRGSRERRKSQKRWESREHWYSELIFRDAAARIRRIGQDLKYQLVVQRVYKQDEEELLDDEAQEQRLVLATCRTFLLLIDNSPKRWQNEGKLGFEKSFGKDSKPQPCRLGLTPAHVGQFQYETSTALSFKLARFNNVEDLSKTYIITATSLFIVIWNIKKILKDSKDPYSIKHYAKEVKADNFKYGNDKNVIVTLPNEVNMVAKQSFKKSTKESIAMLVKVE
ncbi:Vid27 family protein [Sclerotinia borealis F-4128]|uniref:Vid27 family protein n=1 Tax=Sclerotinia borealis (strain F-4128) TaxID=1432307 RepID=W9CAZ5_SCLBF|nr:Vid27 family protein [Sclerotinia borealis F-4128]